MLGLPEACWGPIAGHGAEGAPQVLTSQAKLPKVGPCLSAP